MPYSVDWLWLAEAVSEVADEVFFCDLMFVLGVPYAVCGLNRFKKFTKTLLPVVGYFPMGMLFPPGSREETIRLKYQRHWLEADLIAGDMHYIHSYSPEDLTGKIVITITTTHS